MLHLWDTLTQDLRYGWRGLIRQPGWSVTAIVAAALGIGASTAVFSVVDRLLFRPLPYRAEDRLVSVGMMAPLDTNEFMFASEYFDLRHEPGPFETVTAFQAGSFACDLTEENPRRLKCLRAEANFVPALGFATVTGRPFTAEEDRPNGAPVALISHGLWQSRFGGDAQVIGRKLPIDGVPTLVVGVLPRNFETPTLTQADVLLPLALNEATERQGRALRVFAWLKPKVTIPQALAQLQPHFARTMLTVPKPFRKEVRLAVRPVRDRQAGDARTTALAWLGAVLAVLLIACANIANLLLARASTRERELAVRSALGASRGRLAQQALTESLLLALAGGLGGWVLAYGLLRLLITLAPDALPRMAEATLDERVLVFTVLAAMGSGLLFGLAPALRRTVALGGGRDTGPTRGLLRPLLVGAQVAVSLVLLTGAGLLLQSWWKLARVPLGLQADHVITAQFTLGKQRYEGAANQVGFYRDLEQKLAALPGVTAAAVSDSVPPTGGTRGRLLNTIDVEGKPRRPEGTGGMVSWRFVSPGYFSALGIPVRRGRGFIEADRDPQAFAIILSESLAKQLLPGEDPIGRHVLRSPEEQWATVVGVVGDVKNRGPAQAGTPEFYLLRKNVPDFLFNQQEPPLGWRGAQVIVRTPLDPKYVTSALRGAIESLDPTVPVQISTMRERLAELESGPRFQAILIGLLAAMGLSLAVIGVFGVLSFLVAQRQREIGVRLALGATPGSVVALVLRYAGRWTAAGIVAGVIGSLVIGRLLRSLLFQVEPTDPGALAAAVLLLCGAAGLAALLPARRAARLDPMVVLRDE